MLREFAIAAGLGRKRPRPRKEARPKMGSEGEDVVADEGGGLKLHCPARFQPGTMKAAAWQVHPNFPLTLAQISKGELQVSRQLPSEKILSVHIVQQEQRQGQDMCTVTVTCWEGMRQEDITWLRGVRCAGAV